MKHFLLLSCFISMCFITKAQEEGEKVYTKKELRQIAREEQKAKRKAEEEEMKMLTELMLEKRRFVLEADYVGDGRGSRIPVQSNINFIGLDSTDAVIQLGTTYGAGYNGVGGITVEGRVIKYELSVIEGKRGKSYSLMFIVMTSLGTYDITFIVSGTGYTDATVRGNTMGQLRYSGKLVPIGLSRVYQGTSF